MKKEEKITISSLTHEFEELIRKVDRLLIQCENEKRQKLAETTNLLSKHDPLMNSEQPPMVLLTSLLAALRRVHHVEQLRRLHCELAAIYDTTVMNLDHLPYAWQN